MNTNPIIKHVTVIGGGLMGAGIAQVVAAANYNVTLIEINQTLLDKSEKVIQKNIKRVAHKLYKDNVDEQLKYERNTLEHLQFSIDLTTTVKTTDLVIEAIIENLKEKQKLFETIDKIAPEHTIFASNTSSFLIGEISALTKRKDRFGGLHFFNPVPVMKLLEVIRTNNLSEDTYNKLKLFGEKIGKTCITCKDTPGFVVNRLLMPYTNESINMLDRGDATARDIDQAMKLGAGYPMGPFELLDYIGLDTVYNIRKGMHEREPSNEFFKPSKILEQMVKSGKFGVKSGQGFYEYNKKKLNE